MQTPLTEYKKNIVSIAQFGGLNHTDLTVPGEWYDMCNLSDRYAPLLAPRRSRVRIDTLQGKAEYIIYKNNLYFYSAQDGIYCYAPQGENPFAGGSGDATVRIYESSDVYDFIEMGNKILCVDKTNNEEFVRANESLMQKAFRVIRELLEDLQHFMEDWRKQLPGLYKKVTNIDMIQALYDDVEFIEYTADWVDGILNRNANEVSENANEVAKNENEVAKNENTTAQSAERFSFGNSKAGEQRDKAYMQAARNGDEAKAAEYVEQAAKEWGAFSDGKPEPINLYHGTKSFGFTEFDLKKMDDGRSIFLTSDLETAQSYSGTIQKKRISDAGKQTDYSSSSKEELTNYLNEYMENLNAGKAYDEIIDVDYEFWIKEDIDYFLTHNNESDPAYNNLQHIFKNAKGSLSDGAIIETKGIGNEKLISKKEAIEILKNFNEINRGNYSLYAKFKNPLIIDCQGSDWYEIPFETERKVKRNRFVVRQYLLGEYTIDDWKNEFGFYTDSEENDFKPAGITEFDKELMVFSTEETAKEYLSDFLKKKHLKNYEIEYTESNRLSNTRQVADFAQQTGYDGVVFKNIIDNGGRGAYESYIADYIAVAFDSSQVKSADPITYDDEGNIIPLSERFSDDNFNY